MSFQIVIPNHRRAATRFIGKVRRTLQVALANSPGIRRTDLADGIGVHRSVITRQLNGKKDMSLGRVAELAWAMGYEQEFILSRSTPQNESNRELEADPDYKLSVQTDTANHTDTT